MKRIFKTDVFPLNEMWRQKGFIKISSVQSSHSDVTFVY